MSLARRSQAGMTLIESQRHGAGCELFLVEGESAAGAVAAVRDARTQAVLACQGKPLNAWRATPARVAAYPLYPQLASALGWSSVVDSSATAAPRFERVMLLFDPDADGIHIGALLLLYLQRFAPALLAQGHVFMVRAPLAGLRVVTRYRRSGRRVGLLARTGARPAPARRRRARALGRAARMGLSRPGQPAARGAARYLRRCRHAARRCGDGGADAGGG